MTYTLNEWLSDQQNEALPIKKRLRMFIRLWDGSTAPLQEAPLPTLIEADDVFIAAFAEHLCQVCREIPPAWTKMQQPLKNPLFPGGVSVRALAESPVAFRRRHIFISHVDFPELWVAPMTKGLRMSPQTFT